SNDTPPIDVATVWESDGSLTMLPANGPYRNTYVKGFGQDGSAYGLLRPDSSTEYGFPVFWNDNGIAFLPHFGRGGFTTSANASTIIGETGDPNRVNYVGRVTIWNSDGTNPRVVTGLGDVASRSGSMNASGVYVGVALPPDGPYIGRGFVGQGET